MTLEDFSVADYPPGPEGSLDEWRGFVYIFCWVNGNTEIPFYVGQTNRLLGRMNDYRLANFTACTDFCVGEAIKYLRSKNYQIKVRYNPSPDPPRQEKTIIRRLLVAGVWLVNALPRYEYQTGSESDERLLIQRFCDMFVEKTKSGEFLMIIYLKKVRR
jgi:hypothetical protein